VLTLTSVQRDNIVATCIRALPNEGCGLLLGTLEGMVSEVLPSPNVAESAKLYEIDSRVLLRAYRRSEEMGLSVIGVFHSHTHSEAYPSPTDVAQAPDPTWHYVLVSLRDVPSVIRSFHVTEGVVDEEQISIQPAGTENRAP
jgi:proteasome lid subunit RPN8/RPN11